MNTIDFTSYTDFAKTWNVHLPENGPWTDLLPLIKRICEDKRGYFIFKIDGERTAKKYTFALNIPFPCDNVFRQDTDSIEHGMESIVRGLCEAKLSPDK
jgi:hypothetical protein